MGGMVAALGGAMFFGGARRLWDRFSWQNSIWTGLGLVILANSRPLEGALATLPIAGLFLAQLLRERQWNTSQFWLGFVLPAGVVLLLGAGASGMYNRALAHVPA